MVRRNTASYNGFVGLDANERVYGRNALRDNGNPIHVLNGAVSQNNNICDGAVSRTSSLDDRCYKIQDQGDTRLFFEMVLLPQFHCQNPKNELASVGAFSSPAVGRACVPALLASAVLLFDNLGSDKDHNPERVAAATSRGISPSPGIASLESGVSCLAFLCALCASAVAWLRSCLLVPCPLRHARCHTVQSKFRSK